ncbi:cytochrome P450 [Micromonospora tarensis]|uniref:Cytochrome P450 n=1 Tax=Micromonospora tarensis TaxID=2806100 RepID=A0ABS1YFL4_9ACTN|nr:cytochrome P450 [Micromonospora tarensis]MBM0276001.1 cytochrome P450 [Micromonospora tarensis]
MRTSKPANATTGVAGHPTAPGPAGVPGLGSLLPYRRDPAGFLLRLHRDYGGVARIRMGPMVVHLVTDPEAVRHVLVDNHANYVRGRLYDQFKLVMGRGLLTTDGDYWRGHRRAVQPVFARKALAAIVPNVIEATSQMLDRWETSARAGKPVDLVTEMLELTLVTLSRSLFGYDVSSQASLLKSVVDSSIEIMFPHGYVAEMLPGWLPTARNRRIAANRKVLDRVIDAIRANHARTGDGPLVALMEGARHQDTGVAWSDEEIRDELLTIYLAGHETTATALSWALLSAANHRWAQEEMEAEIEAVLAGRLPGIDDELPYTSAVIDESLRMYPPIWLYPRDVVADDVLGGYGVPGDTSVLLSPLVSQRNPEVWENPEAFDPRRFLPGADRGRPRMSYFPFGGGPRLCLGNLMALAELRLIVAMITQRFRFSLVPGDFVGYGDSLISLRPTTDMWVRLQSRSRAEAAR